MTNDYAFKVIALAPIKDNKFILFCEKGGEYFKSFANTICEQGDRKNINKFHNYEKLLFLVHNMQLDFIMTITKIKNDYDNSRHLSTGKN